MSLLAPKGTPSTRTAVCPDGRRNEVKSEWRDTNVSVSEGFTFIEIMLALAMFSIISVSVLGLLNGSLNFSFKSHSIVSRIFYIKGLLYNPQYLADLQKDQKKVIEKKIDEPQLDLKLNIEPLNKNLAKKFENCYLYKARGDWVQFGLNQENTIFAVGYIQKIEKESTYAKASVDKEKIN